MSDLYRLLELCPPPASPRPHVPAGPAARTDAGRRIPRGHRDLLEAYGVGSFDDFVWVYGDGCANPHLDIWAKTESARSGLRERSVPELRKSLSNFGRGTDDLVQWGGTDNGDSLLWLPVGDPAAWPTVIIEVRQRLHLVVPDSSAGVLFSLLSGRLRTGIFPDDFPSSKPQFRPRHL